MARRGHVQRPRRPNSTQARMHTSVLSCVDRDGQRLIIISTACTHAVAAASSSACSVGARWPRSRYSDRRPTGPRAGRRASDPRCSCVAPALLLRARAMADLRTPRLLLTVGPFQHCEVLRSCAAARLKCAKRGIRGGVERRAPGHAVTDGPWVAASRWACLAACTGNPAGTSQIDSGPGMCSHARASPLAVARAPDSAWLRRRVVGEGEGAPPSGDGAMPAAPPPCALRTHATHDIVLRRSMQRQPVA